MGPKRQGTRRTSTRRSVAVMESQGNAQTASVKTTTVHSVTESGTQNTVKRRQSSGGEKYVYQKDYWERSPKTDYTYAHSISYSTIQPAKWVSPNMSRQSLRGGSTHTVISPVAAMSQLNESMTRSEFKTTSSRQMRTSSSTSSSGSRRRGRILREDHRTAALAENTSPPLPRIRRRNDPSTTRSGRRYSSMYYNFYDVSRQRHSTGNSTAPSVQIQTHDNESMLSTASHYSHNNSMYAGYDAVDATDAGGTSRANYRQIEKRLEYSGEASPYKEKSLSHLYGLDEEEEYGDISDTETSVYTSRTSQQTIESTTSSMSVASSVVTSTTSFIQSFFSFILMVLVSSWQIISRSVISAASYISQRFASTAHDTAETEDLSYEASSARTSAARTSAARTSSARTSGRTSTRSTRRTSARTLSATSNAVSEIEDSSSAGASSANNNVGLDNSVYEASSSMSSQRSLFSAILANTGSAATWLVGGLFSWLYERLWVLYHWFWVTGLGSSLKSCMWASGCRIYSLVASILVADVWLLSRSAARRRCGCCCLLPLLLLLPLFLTSSYYVYEEGSEALVALLPLPLGFVATNKVVVKEPPVVIAGGISDQELHDKVTQIIMAFYNERDAQQLQAAAAADSRHEELVLQQQNIYNMFNTHKTDVEGLVRTLVQEHLGAFAAAASASNKDSASRDEEQAARMMQIQLEQGAELKALNEKLLAVTEKHKGMEEALLAALADMNSADAKVRSESAASAEALREQIAGLKADIAAMQAANEAFILGMKDCCKNDSALAALVAAGVKDQVEAILLGAAGGGGGGGAGFGSSGDGSDSVVGAMGVGGGKDTTSSAFAVWLHRQYASQEDLDSKIAAMAAQLRDQFKNDMDAQIAAGVLAAESEATKAAYIAAAAAVANMSSTEKSSTTAATAGATETRTDTLVVTPGCSGLSKQEVDALIRAEVLKFWADRTGMVDFALESAGGSVISTRCSETYYQRAAQLSLFGIPLWYVSNSPRTVIQPDVHPGQCWAFHGVKGYLVIELAATIKPTAFSLEHIPKSLSPNGKIESAPKDFSVWGLKSPQDTEGVLLGNFTYDADNNDQPLQHFAARDPEGGAYQYIEMQIHSNHGNPEYTCVYRFRVHGKPIY